MGRPSTRTRSRHGSMRVPSVVTARPFTSTRPAWIKRSASRREATPAEAMNFCRRTPAPPSGVVPVVFALVLVLGLVIDLLVVIVLAVSLRFLERSGRGRSGQRRGQAAKLLRTRQVLERVQTEVGEKIAGGAVEQRLAHHLLAAQHADELLLEQAVEDGAGVGPANGLNLRRRDRLAVGHDGQGLQGGRRQAAPVARA